MDVVDVAIDDLRPDSANPRRISSAQATALTRSLEKFGFVQSLLVRREDGTVIGGQQRLGAARRLGYKTVPVTYLGLMREQARVLNVGPNKISGEWDHEKLASMLADLTPVEDLDLTLTGFKPRRTRQTHAVAGRALEEGAAGKVRPQRGTRGRMSLGAGQGG